MFIGRAETTRILIGARNGCSSAANTLIPLVYAELRKIASRFLAGERRDHTLQATALVNEAYLRMVDQRELTADDRTRFVALAATSMRRILADYARERNALKRAAPGRRVTVSWPEVSLGPSELDPLELSELLNKLSKLNARHAQVVELRIYAGLTIAETAKQLGLSDRSISLEWRNARAWLEQELDRSS